MKKNFIFSGALIYLVAIILVNYPAAGLCQTNQNSNPEAMDSFRAGVDNAKAGKFDLAIKSFEKVISIDSKNSNAYVGLGNMYLQKGDLAKSAEYYNKAIAVDNSSIFAYTGLGNIYSQKGDTDKAISYYEKALAIDNNNAMAYSGLGNVYGRKGDTDKAIKCYNKAIALDKNPIFYFHLGVFYVSQNNKNEALKIVEILKKLDKSLADRLENQLKAPQTPGRPPGPVSTGNKPAVQPAAKTVK